MNFDGIGPAGRVTHLPAREPASATPVSGDFAKVYDLAEARRAALPDVPAHVWDEVERAAQVAADLEAAGRAVRFWEPEQGGRVRAELTDAGSGAVVRPLSLGEIASIGSNEPPTAA